MIAAAAQMVAAVLAVALAARAAEVVADRAACAVRRPRRTWGRP